MQIVVKIRRLIS